MEHFRRPISALVSKPSRRHAYFGGSEMTTAIGLAARNMPFKTMHSKGLPIGRSLALVFLLGMYCSGYASAQVATGDILGTVTDSSGAIVPNASVKLRNTGTQELRDFTTNSSGSYAFTLLQPGAYTVTVTEPG